jgi:glycogen synthase
MKVLMTTDTVGGVWSYAMELTRALARFGVEICLATMGASLPRSQRAEIQSRPNITVHESSFRLEWMPDPWGDVQKAGAWLLEIAADTNPDIVHLNGYAHGALPWPAPVLMVGHSCVLSWWQAVRGEPAPARWDHYQRAVTRGLRAADTVVAPSRAMLKTLEQFYGPLPQPRVIPNARDPQAYASARKESWVLAAGRLWDAGKNVQALARVAPRLSWPVCIAGETKDPEGAVVSFPSVRALGKLTSHALAGCYARASIYAMPARYEPFGLSALEAALADCALVLGDIPSLREIWTDAALFVPPDDHEALEKTIEMLIADDQLRARQAAKARARALRFTPRRMGTGYYAAYTQLIAAHKLRPTRVAAGG